MGATRQVRDVVTATVRRMPSGRNVIVGVDDYVEVVRAGGLNELRKEPPTGAMRSLSDLAAGDRFAAWDATFDPTGWWVFEVLS